MNWKIGNETFPVKINADLKEIESFDLCVNEQAALKVLKVWLSGADPEFLTSGTTGERKPVTIPRELIKWSIRNTALITGSDNVVLIAIPCERIGGAMQVLRAFENDDTIRVLDPSSHPLKEVPDDHDLTLTSLVPFQIYHIMDDPAQFEQFRRFRCALIGGEPMIPAREQELIQKLGQSGPDLIHTYGMTETASHIATRRFGKAGYTPFSGVKISTDTKGHLRIEIPEVGLTINTTDEVNIESDGTFILKGRNAFTVNSAGRKIRIEELEHRIHEIVKDRSPHPYALWKEADDQLGERLILMVAEHFDFPVDQVEKELTRFDHPRRIYKVKEILRNSSGKIDRKGTYASINQNQK